MNEDVSYVQMEFKVPDTLDPEDYGSFVKLVKFQNRVSATLHGGEPLEPTKENLTAYAAALMVEVGELLNELNWKPWKKNHGVNVVRATDEWADVTAFYLVLTDLVSIVLGIPLPDMLRHYADVKSVTNRKRLAGAVDGYGLEEGGRREP